MHIIIQLYNIQLIARNITRIIFYTAIDTRYILQYYFNVLFDNMRHLLITRYYYAR